MTTTTRTIEDAAQLLDANRDLLTDEGFDVRRRALDEAREYGADDPDFGARKIAFAIAGLEER